MSLDLFIQQELKKQKIKLWKPNKKELKKLSDLEKSTDPFSLPPYLIRKKLPYQLGYGIFLHPEAEPIKKNEIIGIYKGELSLCAQNEYDSSLYAFTLISDIKLNKTNHFNYDLKRKYHPNRLYLIKLDAEKKGNFTRFINHSYQPNLESDLMMIPKNDLGIPELAIGIIYTAKKKIKPAEQLLISYEDGDDSYWAPLKIKPFPLTPRTFTLSSSLDLRDNSHKKDRNLLVK